MKVYPVQIYLKDLIYKMGRPDFVRVSFNICFHMKVTAEIKDDFSSSIFWYTLSAPQDIRNNIYLDIVRKLKESELDIKLIDEFAIRWCGLDAEVSIGTWGVVDDKILESKNPFDEILSKLFQEVDVYEYKQPYVYSYENNIPNVKETHMSYQASVNGIAIDYKVLEE